MIKFGIDIAIQNNPSWKNLNIGLITNNAATTATGISSRKTLIDNGFNIIKLFSPEHGLDTRGADGAFIDDGIDELTQLPIISLYGAKLAPNEHDLSDIDILLFDIPDVGVRFYTYLWTLSYALEACAKWNKKFILLDRPNPIGGSMHWVEGPMLSKNCSSYIGRWTIPIRHSCTLGELAIYFNNERNINTNLLVIACEGWNRNMLQPNWGLSFVPTSPAIQSFGAMQLYPGLCFLEATNLSEGRGTNLSFQAVAAPWLEVSVLIGLLRNMFRDELEFESISFISGEEKYKGEICNGLAFKVMATADFKPVFFGLILIKLIIDIHPRHFSWHRYCTHANPTGSKHLDKLLGIDNAEALFTLAFPQFLVAITKALKVDDWRSKVEGSLLY
jgi:uncharacterized protein YbbC (DUF1343 family)